MHHGLNQRSRLFLWQSVVLQTGRDDLGIWATGVGGSLNDERGHPLAEIEQNWTNLQVEAVASVSTLTVCERLKRLSSNRLLVHPASLQCFGGFDLCRLELQNCLFRWEWQIDRFGVPVDFCDGRSQDSTLSGFIFDGQIENPLAPGHCWHPSETGIHEIQEGVGGFGWMVVQAGLIDRWFRVNR